MPGQAFEVARGAVVADHHHAGVQQARRDLGNLPLARIHGHRGGLQHRRAGVDVDDQPGQAVAFAVDGTKGVAVEGKPTAKGEGAGEALLDQGEEVGQARPVTRRPLTRRPPAGGLSPQAGRGWMWGGLSPLRGARHKVEDSEGDRRLRGPGRDGEWPLALVGDQHHGRAARARVGVRTGEHVLAVHPDLAAGDARAAARSHLHRRRRCGGHGPPQNCNATPKVASTLPRLPVWLGLARKKPMPQAPAISAPRPNQS